MARWNPDADPGRFEGSSEIRFVSDRRGRPIADVVLQWITSMMSRISLPIFRLEDPREYNLRDSMGFVANSLPFGAEPRRRTDSGILEIQFREAGAFLREQSVVSLIESLETFASREYARSFRRLEQAESHVVLAQMSSRLNIEGIRPRVIGPGGRITVYRGTDWTEVDLAVRRRVAQINSKWRRPERIMDGLLREIGLPPDGLELTAQFGYLELSKYELQEWLRPAFLFVVQTSSSGEYRVPWQFTTVEPASVAAEIPNEEGLGAWGEAIFNE
jgi:hypothetical protein